jgi:hypothetical protein
MSDIVKRLREGACGGWEAADEIERLCAERAGDQQRLFHYEGKLLEDGKRITEAAAFLDRMADRADDAVNSDDLNAIAADSRAMAGKLRGERA